MSFFVVITITHDGLLERIMYFSSGMMHFR